MENIALPDIVREHVPLQDHSTFKIGGPARYFCAARNGEETRRALDFAIARRLPVFVLGKGSNLLFSDRGFPGLVLKLEDRSWEVVPAAAGQEAVIGAGAYLTKVVVDLAQRGLGGLEWAAGIPATLGGAVANNAGAHGHDLSESVRQVRVLEMELDAQHKYLKSYAYWELSREDCAYAYRSSLFKTAKNFVILGATLSLVPGDKEAIGRTIADFVQSRIDKQPLQFPNIGSIFKNPTLGQAELDRALHDYPAEREKFSSGTLPAGWLIEEAGLKGQVVGGAQISEKHANFIVNVGGATAEDVVILISLVKQKVRVKFDLQLHEEIECVGF